MKKRIVTVSLLVLAAMRAEASMVWQPAPPKAQKGAAVSGHMSHGGGADGMPFLLTQGQGTEAEIWLPTRVRRPLQVGMDGRVAVKGTGVSSYHLLFARKSSETDEAVAMRYIGQRGKPSGESPASLVNISKASLDINPAPLTREHQRYTSKNSFSFVVSYKGTPLASHAVSLTTSNGTTVEGKSDSRGKVTFSLPDDFVDVEPGRGANRPADFVVAVAHEDAGKTFHTTLSAPYYVNPSHWQSMTGGLLAMFAGVVTGLAVLRRGSNTTTNAETGRD